MGNSLGGGGGNAPELVGCVLEFYEAAAPASVGVEAGSKKAVRKNAVLTHRVAVKKLLASGGFADVYWCKATRDSPAKKGARRGVFATKHMRVQSDEQLAAVEREIAAHRAVRHPNLMELLGDAFDRTPDGMRHAYLLFPLVSGGTVFDALEAGSAPVGASRAKLDEVTVLRIFAGACAGVAAMHEVGLAHRDVKPRNLLLTGKDLRVVVTDLGSIDVERRVVTNRKEALDLEEQAAENCTAPFRAPELHQVERECVVDGRADVWSLGCVLYALAFGHNVFESAEEGVKKLAILSATFSLPAARTHRGVAYSEAFEKLVRVQLQRKAEKRPTASQLLLVVEKLETRIVGGAEERREEAAAPASPVVDSAAGSAVGSAAPAVEATAAAGAVACTLAPPAPPAPPAAAAADDEWAEEGGAVDDGGGDALSAAEAEWSPTFDES